MTLQPTEIGLPTLTPRDQPVIEALEADFLERGQGVARARVGVLADTTYPERVIRRIRAAGFKVDSIGSTDDTISYQLRKLPPNPSAPDDGRSAVTPAADSSSGADVEGQLFAMPSTSHWAADREAA